MIQITSEESYREILKELGPRQRAVLVVIRKLKECNNLMISKFLLIPINAITPRVLELRKKGLVIQSKIDKCPYTDRLSIFWRYNEL